MASSVIEIKSVTRIEGGMKVIINLDEHGDVHRAHANTLEFRGFEAFLRGRHMDKVPQLTPRICGVCPVPHHLASLKAIEQGLGITVPDTARKLRELMLAAAHLNDHVLHMFALGGPDILLADLAPEIRGLGTLYDRYPDVVKQVFRVVKATQRIISVLGVQAVHPGSGIPGGMNLPLSEANRDRLLADVAEIKPLVLDFYGLLIPLFQAAEEAHRGLGQLETAFLANVKGDSFALYDGTTVRAVDVEGTRIAEFESVAYTKYLGELCPDDSYAKTALLKTATGDGAFRTGPIAMVNVADTAGTPYAQQYLDDFRARFGRPAQQTLALDVARAVAMVFALERVEELLKDPQITSKDTLTPVKYRAGEGVGVLEAPRGVLVHHFAWDNDGYLTKANVITPTNANMTCIDNSLTQVAKRSIQEGQVDNWQLENEIGMTVRAYDPCMSCSTHFVRDEQEHLIEIVDVQGNRRFI